MVAGQPVLLQRQPWNEYDSGAVTIRTLQGTDLGFVPREINPRFQVRGGNTLARELTDALRWWGGCSSSQKV